MTILVRYFNPLKGKVETNLWYLAQIHVPTVKPVLKTVSVVESGQDDNLVNNGADPSTSPDESSSRGNFTDNKMEEVELREENEDHEVKIPVLQCGTAAELFKTLCESFSNFQLPNSNIVGFSSDGANVMLGKQNSVGSRFRENFPGIYLMKCICHSLHLCASKSCLDLPRSCDDLARNIFFFTSVIVQNEKPNFNSSKCFLMYPFTNCCIDHKLDGFR